MKTIQENIFYILMVLAMAGWGASWVNAKVLSEYINEYELIFFRNLFTIITLIPVMIIMKRSFSINKRSLLLCIGASLVMVAYMKYYFLGTKFGTASLGGAFVTTLIPINTFIITAILYRKSISFYDAFALLLGAIGVCTMLDVWSFDPTLIFVEQNIYFIYASLLWAVLTIISSKTTNTSPMAFTLYMYFITSFMVSFTFVDFETLIKPSYDELFWLNILSLAIVSTTFATSVYFMGVEKLGAKEVSTFIFLVPFFAICLSALFLGEPIDLMIVLGSALTMFAIKILNTKKS